MYHSTTLDVSEMASDSPVMMLPVLMSIVCVDAAAAAAAAVVVIDTRISSSLNVVMALLLPIYIYVQFT